MNYCGVAVGAELLQLCRLEETRADEPPIRLQATFYEPGSPAEVVGELMALADVVVAVGAPQGGPFEGRVERACDAALRRRGVTPKRLLESGLALYDALEELGIFDPEVPPGQETGPDGEFQGLVEEGTYRDAPVFEVNPDGIFCALEGRRVPARRHPLGIITRIDELTEDSVEDPGGDLWSRRIEEIEAAAAALCAHRYAVGHAAWIGDPDEGVIALPGSYPPPVYSSEGVVPRMPRVPLGGAEGAQAAAAPPPGAEGEPGDEAFA